MKAILTTLFFMCSSLLLQAQAEMQTFTGDSAKFTISYPQEWIADDESYGDQISVEVESPKLNNAKRAEVMIRMQAEDLEPGIKTISDIEKKMKLEMKKNMKDIKILEAKRAGDQYFFVIQMKAKDKILKSKTIFRIENKKMITASYACEMKNYAKYLKDAEAVMESFKLN